MMCRSLAMMETMTPERADENVKQAAEKKACSTTTSEEHPELITELAELSSDSFAADKALEAHMTHLDLHVKSFCSPADRPFDSGLKTIP